MEEKEIYYTKLVYIDSIYLMISSSTNLSLAKLIKYYEDQGFNLISKTQITYANKVKHLAEMQITSQEVFHGKG